MRIRDERGAASVEYGVIIGILAMVVVAGIAVLGLQMSSSFRSAGGALEPAGSQAAAAAEAADETADETAAAPAPAPEAGGTDEAAGSGTVPVGTIPSEGTVTPEARAEDEAAKEQAAEDEAAKEQAAQEQAAKEQAAKDEAAKAEDEDEDAALAADDWKQVAGAMGTAKISGSSVVTTPGSAATVMNAARWSSPDMTLSTEARLVRPDANTTDGGYALWVRATTNKYGQVESGYTFQVDPGVGNAFVVRVWNNQKQSDTLARVKFPKGFDPTDEKSSVSVSVVGDRLVATVDGEEVLTIKSLSKEVGKLKPLTIGGTTYVDEWTAPTGTGYGLRTWGSTGLEASDTTIR